jgi:uncharacterized damage-inducible protein DinB
VQAGFDIVPIWRRLNEQLVDLIAHVPDEHLDWAPKPELWSFRRLFLHLAAARDEWMFRAIDDGEPGTGLDLEARTKEELRHALQRTWWRVERTISDQSRLAATYRDRWWAEAPPRTGHWVAFHLLEHDIHHRADMLLYLALLGIETPSDWTQTP